MTRAGPKSENEREATLEVGIVVKPHGIRGAVKVRLHSGEPAVLDRREQLVLRVAGAERAVPFRVVGLAADGLLLQLQGVASREAAEELRGAAILVERAKLPPLQEGEYYYADLVGCRVEDEGGCFLGTVHRVFSAGAGDVLVVRDERSERMIPLVDDWVRSVDLEARRIQVVGVDSFEPSPW
jgi:16S rRNA processing protein RimM